MDHFSDTTEGLCYGVYKNLHSDDILHALREERTVVVFQTETKPIWNKFYVPALNYKANPVQNGWSDVI